MLTCHIPSALAHIAHDGIYIVFLISFLIFLLCALVPAQLAYEVLGSLGDLLGEVHLLYAFQDERVRHHLVAP